LGDRNRIQPAHRNLCHLSPKGSVVELVEELADPAASRKQRTNPPHFEVGYAVLAPPVGAEINLSTRTDIIFPLYKAVNTFNFWWFSDIIVTTRLTFVSVTNKNIELCPVP